jgi:hypothetical protein
LYHIPSSCGCEANSKADEIFISGERTISRTAITPSPAFFLLRRFGQDYGGDFVLYSTCQSISSQMASSVFYKFRSQREESRVTFDGTGISVFDLKKEIILANNLGKANDFDLFVYDSSSNEGA